MALHNQPVEAQVHGLLAERSYQVAASTDVTRVADDGQFRYAAVQFDRNLPHGQVAVNLLVEARKATMDGTQPFDAGLVDALQGPNPQLQVGIHGVLHQHGHVHAPQGVGQSLHGKGVGRGSGAHPKDVNAILERQFHMLGCSHFGSREHAGFVLHAPHPGQGFFTFALESARFGARFPHTRPENMATFSCQFTSGGHHLLFRFGRTGAGYHA